MSTLIVSGGSICDELLPREIDKYDTVIAADKGLEALLRNNITPDYIVGDFDSGSEEALRYAKESGIPFKQLVPEKDDTDTESALNLAFEKTSGDITIIGGTGTRLDHVLGNISILGLGFKQNRRICLMDSHNRISMYNGPFELARDPDYIYLSLIAWGGDVTGLTLKGLKYETDHITLGCFTSLGVSNEIVSEKASVEFEYGTLVVIESRD